MRDSRLSHYLNMLISEYDKVLLSFVSYYNSLTSIAFLLVCKAVSVTMYLKLVLSLLNLIFFFSFLSMPSIECDEVFKFCVTIKFNIVFLLAINFEYAKQ